MEEFHIGIFSDTHGWLDTALIEHFADCQEIWHAGDIGNLSVINHWQKKGNIRAVWGNIDGHEVRSHTKEYFYFEAQGFPILMIHIAGKYPRYTPQTKELIKLLKPKMLVCGHSHVCRVVQEGGILYVNPGAAGRNGFHHIRTALKLKFVGGKPVEMKVIELGPRSEQVIAS